MNRLSQIDPEMLKMLLMQQGQQGMPQEQPPMPPQGMGDPSMPTNIQQQFDPQMLAALLRGKMQIPPGTPTIGVRG